MGLSRQGVIQAGQEVDLAWVCSVEAGTNILRHLYHLHRHRLAGREDSGLHLHHLLRTRRWDREASMDHLGVREAALAGSNGE